MRSVIKDDEELQTQSDENGREYVYRKDYLRTGDQRNEYSLSLVYSRVGTRCNVSEAESIHG